LQKIENISLNDKETFDCEFVKANSKKGIDLENYKSQKNLHLDDFNINNGIKKSK